MAATNFTPISLYYSTTASAVPSAGNLVAGELALNTADMKLYAKNSAGTVTLLASSGGAAGTVSSVAATVPSFLSITGSPITTSGTLAISLSGSALPTTSGGTGLTSFNANGVVYASSSSVLASGTTLTYDGTTLGVRATSFTPSSSASSVLIEDKTTWSQGLQFYLNNAGTYFSSRPSGALGAANSGGLMLTAGALLTNDPSSSNGFTATTSAASVYNPVGGAHIWYGNTGLTAGNTFTATEQMRLTSTGLGIGTSSPAYAVDIRTAASNSLRVGSSANAFGSLLEWNNASGFGRVGTLGGYPFDLATNGSTRFRVGDAGEFGIGGSTYGTAGQVLTSGGSGAAPTWATPSSGGVTSITAGSGISVSASTGAVTVSATGGAAGLVRVATSTVSGGITQVNLDGISSTYTNYLLMIEGAFTFDGPSPNLTMRMRCSGSTDSNSAYAFVYNQSTGTWSGGSAGPDTSIGLVVLFPNGYNPATSYFGYVYISTHLNASATSYVIRFNSYVTNSTSSLGAVYPNITAGTYRGSAGLNSDVTGVALRLAGLNMYGKYTLYGLT